MRLRLIARVLLILFFSAFTPRMAASQTLPPALPGAYIVSPAPRGWIVLDPADPLYPLRTLGSSCGLPVCASVFSYGETLITRAGDMIELLNTSYGGTTVHSAGRRDVNWIRPYAGVTLPFAGITSVETRNGTVLVFGATGEVAEVDFARKTVQVKPFRLQSAAADLAVDLAADSCTLSYTGVTSVRRFDVCSGRTLGAIEVGASPGGIRILPDASLLVALPDRIERLDSAGTVIRSYDHSAVPRWSAIALNPDGKTFIAGGNSNFIVEFELDSGLALVARETFPLSPNSYLRLGVLGEPRAAAVAAVPAIGSSIALVIALALLALFALR